MTMRFLALVLGIVLLVSMGIGGAAHASERVCDGTEEVQRDHPGERSSGGDTEPAHVHGCHGHHVAAPTTAGETVVVRTGERRLNVRGALYLPGRRAGPELRPPQA